MTGLTETNCLKTENILKAGGDTPAAFETLNNKSHSVVVTKLHLRLSHNDSSPVAAKLYPKARSITAASKHGRWKSA